MVKFIVKYINHKTKTVNFVIDTRTPKVKKKKKLLRKKNLKSTPPEVIVDQMNEPRPLPLGRKDFDEWAERIISGTLLKGDDHEKLRESQKFTLASMLLHIGPTESHKPDAHFIHGLRVAAIKQVGHTMLTEIKEAQLKREVQAKRRLEEAAKEAEKSEKEEIKEWI